MTQQESRDLILKFLKDRKAAVLSTISEDGHPQSATLFYAIDDDFTFNFVTNTESRKWKNLKENQNVAIVVGSGPEVVTVQCGGQAEIVDYAHETKKFGDIIEKVAQNSKLHSDPPAWPVLKSQHPQLGVFTVKPQWLAFLNLEIRTGGEAYTPDYIQITP